MYAFLKKKKPINTKQKRETRSYYLDYLEFYLESL